MKGKLITGVSISDNEMIAIGTEVEIVDVRYGFDAFYMCIIPDGRQITINANDIDITDYSRYIDWEQRRYEIAKSVIPGLISSPIIDPVEIASISVTISEALIEELKKGK